MRLSTWGECIGICDKSLGWGYEKDWAAEWGDIFDLIVINGWRNSCEGMSAGMIHCQHQIHRRGCSSWHSCVELQILTRTSLRRLVFSGVASPPEVLISPTFLSALLKPSSGERTLCRLAAHLSPSNGTRDHFCFSSRLHNYSSPDVALIIRWRSVTYFCNALPSSLGFCSSHWCTGAIRGI